MTKFKLQKKCQNKSEDYIFKPHAHLQSMVKTYVKFQKNRNKTVRGVIYDEVQIANKSRDDIQSTRTSSKNVEAICKVLRESE